MKRLLAMFALLFVGYLYVIAYHRMAVIVSVFCIILVMIDNNKKEKNDEKD